MGARYAQRLWWVSVSSLCSHPHISPADSHFISPKGKLPTDYWMPKCCLKAKPCNFPQAADPGFLGSAEKLVLMHHLRDNGESLLDLQTQYTMWPQIHRTVSSTFLKALPSDPIHIFQKSRISLSNLSKPSEHSPSLTSSETPALSQFALTLKISGNSGIYLIKWADRQIVSQG